ncbi:putative DNA-binding transcriptional regulator YafY [Stackebrandtia albiflava]|uniref:Putative DNA-binding transcriptional regulator YafY n=1 Tax=Stackebrandtia albiflava TaxID=406432 RepID=A0A562V527_9ACTN|nr:WYL domain-containing protein [Stackebrandtia albiflava]TWJ13001.1 putative DNA-binding transcriptional regulator YafY [Stackebrandtia albiflava]
MADVTERMLALLSTLQTGRAFSGAELSRRLHVSPRTLRRDVDRLRGYGYPVETRPGPGGHYRLAAGRTMPPLVLDDDEAVAVLLALAAFGAVGSAVEGGVDEAATRALGKLDQFLPRRLRPRMAAVRASLEAGHTPAPPVTAGLFDLVAGAVADHDVVSFGYVDAHGGRSVRRVEPYRQVHHLLRWYLLGWDLDRRDWRVFRADRVEDPLRTGERFTPRALPASSAAEFVRRAVGRDRRTVTLRVAAPVTAVADALRFQDARIRPVDDTTTEVRLAPESWQWLVLNLAFLEADFTLTDDDRFAADCRAFAERLLAGTAGPK